MYVCIHVNIRIFTHTYMFIIFCLFIFQMLIAVYVCICVYVHTHTYMHTQYIYSYTHVHVYTKCTYICIFIHTQTCMHNGSHWRHTNTHTHTRNTIYVSIHTCMYTQYTYIYKYIYIYSYTHIHADRHWRQSVCSCARACCRRRGKGRGRDWDARRLCRLWKGGGDREERKQWREKLRMHEEVFVAWWGGGEVVGTGNITGRVREGVKVFELESFGRHHRWKKESCTIWSRPLCFGFLLNVSFRRGGLGPPGSVCPNL